ncbi:deoxyuridine 5'-triphosphate nucleotidohydrolase [Paenibacillus sp. FSL L8-0340]|uniref:dUTP diphosphatase n=1 Tax=Paenibacillus sp. FSL L8-0340 TaxID=2954685 RepID=UPI0031594184
MNEVNVKITLLPGAELPKYARPGDSGFDLVAQEDYVVEPGQTVKVRTGICVELPVGTELQVRPRSGISANTKLRVANSPGTGDSSYRGEICVLIDNIAQPVAREIDLNEREVTYDQSEYVHTLDGEYTRHGWQDRRDPTYLIRKGDRIAQAIIAPVYRASFEVVTELAESERGTLGFGSSGVTTEGVNAE